ncbi:hypothetical protein B0H14DRAFT_136106 [Mycena olivaceomarginata]|nr:hypothetical protein B0H14DRAFT_136106 [Mycena olivaceomarginata]
MRAEPPPCAEAARGQTAPYSKLRDAPSRLLRVTTPSSASEGLTPTPAVAPPTAHSRHRVIKRASPSPVPPSERERVVESEIPALPFSSCSSSFKCRSFTRAQPGCRWCLCRPLRKLHFLDLGTEQRILSATGYRCTSTWPASRLIPYRAARCGRTSH